MKKKIQGLLALVCLTVIPTVSVIHAAETSETTPLIRFATTQSAYIEADDELHIDVYIDDNPGIVSLTLPVVWDADVLELISVENTEELIPNWYGPELPGDTEGLYFLAWNNDTYHDGNYGKAEYSGNGILCTMVFRAKEDLHTGDLTMYVDTADPIANIMNWEMEDHLHKNASDSIYMENDFLFSSGVIRTGGDLNTDGTVNAWDAVYLLNHTINAEEYPLDADADYNRDGSVTAADALYLLRHTILPERYPLG